MLSTKLCFILLSNLNYTTRLVSNGGVVGTGWERDGSGDGQGTPFRDKPPPPPVVSKGCVESGEFNKRATSRQPGGLSRKGVLSRLLYQPFYKIVQMFSSFLFSLRWCGKDNRTQSKKKGRLLYTYETFLFVQNK